MVQLGAGELKIRRRASWLTALACLVLLAALVVPVGAQGNAVYFITNVAATEFPQVTFDFRAVDLANQTIPSLNSVNVAVYENGLLVPEVNITPHNDGPIHYIFVVDLGRQSNYQNFGLANLRTAITTLVNDGYFVDGVDTVQVMGRRNINSDQTETLLASTTRGSDLVNWAANFNFQRSNGPTKGLLAVEEAVAFQAAEGPLPGSETTAIIFITRFIEEPRSNVAIPAAESSAQIARRQYISTYVFHTDTGRSGREPLEILAAGSNGLYLNLQRNTVATQAGDIYRGINGQRTWYSAAYRSQLGTNGVRVITLNTAESPGAGQAGTYTVEVEPPSVTLTEPNPGSTLVREPSLGADGVTYVYPADTTVSVTAQVTWPEGAVPRQIERAQFLVDGVLQDTAQPAAGETRLNFEWDISDVTGVGLNTAQLEVRVSDELDVEAASPPAEITIQVIAPPTPVPEDPFQQRVRELTGSVNLLWVVIPLGLLGLLLAFVLAAVVLVVTRPTQARKMVSDVRNTLLGGGPRGKSRILATMKVLDGPKSWVGETINISKDKTTMGRNPQAVDIPFYRDEESSISRVHCTIQLDRNAFLLTDHGSTSGTRVNGEWLKPNDPVQLRDGDEIVMGDLTQRGVKLRFSYMLNRTEAPAASIHDRTAVPDKVERTGDKSIEKSGEKSTDKTMWEGFKWDEDKWNEDQ